MLKANDKLSWTSKGRRLEQNTQASRMRETLSEFIRLRKRWFVFLSVVTFFCALFIAGRKYDSVIEVVVFAFLGSLVVTTLISLASMPFVFLLARRRVASREQAERQKR